MIVVNQQLTHKVQVLVGGTVQTISKWGVQEMEPLYIPFREKMQSCIKEYLVKVATEVSPEKWFKDRGKIIL